MQQNTYPKWQCKPALLSKEDLRDPMSVLTTFFQTHNLPSFREQLWEILSTAIKSNSATFHDGKEVGEWMFLYRHLQELVEACWMLDQQNGKISSTS